MASSPRKNRSTKRPGSKGRAKKTSRPARLETSSPDIRVAYGPVGRETLAAIAEELAAAAQPTAFTEELPRLELDRSPLDDAAEPVKPGLSRPPGVQGRPRMSTLGYEQRPIAPSLRVPRAQRPGSAPQLSLGSGPAGRETLSAIAEELGGEPTTGVRPKPERQSRPAEAAPPGRQTLRALEAEFETRLGRPEPGAAPKPLEVFEMATFVVRGPDVGRLSSEKARREFVEERLMHRLPVQGIDQIDRIDVTPWTVRGTLVVRVWCRVERG